MKILTKLLLIVLALSMLVTSLASCELLGLSGNDNGGDTSGSDEQGGNQDNGPGEFIDYASQVKFNPSSGRAHISATVKTFVDGDTTHFEVSDRKIAPTGILKARYIAINTPESTGQIEPWGKKASNYTKGALSEATDIILESDTSAWNLDSTGDRHLVWVWYKTADDNDYRNLNLEILQSGLAIASNSSKNSYGDVAVKMLSQAMAHKLYVHSKEKDPDFYYGAAMPITLKELKLNIEEYKNKDVSFEGVVVRNSAQTAYVEEYDEETGTYFGIQVYYGFGLNSFGLEILNVGNRVRITGSVQYYETGGTYQISDIKYNAMIPDHEDNILKISTGHEAPYREVDVPTLLEGKLTYEVTTTDDDGNESVETKTFDYGFIGMHSSASIKNLTITDVYTTPDGNSAGAMSITCRDEDGNEVILRTIVLKDNDGKTVTASEFPIGSVINAKGIIDVFNGAYQLGIFSKSDITFVNAD